MSRDPLATTCADGCLPGVSARFLHDAHGLCEESNAMPGAVLKQQKGLSRDLVGGGFAKWHIRKAVQKQAADSFRASRDGAEVTFLTRLSAAEQRYSNKIGGITIGEVIQGR